jgi:outer membrane usher protein
VEWEPKRVVSKTGISGALAALLASVSSLYLLQDSESAPDEGDGGVADPESDALMSLKLDPAPTPRPTKADRRSADAQDDRLAAQTPTASSTRPIIAERRAAADAAPALPAPASGGAEAPTALPAIAGQPSPPEPSLATVRIAPVSARPVAQPTRAIAAPPPPTPTRTAATATALDARAPSPAETSTPNNGKMASPPPAPPAIATSPPARLADVPASSIPVQAALPPEAALNPQPFQSEVQTPLDADAGGGSLVLAPIVNDTPIDRVLTVTRGVSGDFGVLAEDLRALRIKVDPQIKDGASVPLASLPGLTARYIESSQSLALSVPDALLFPTILDVSRQEPVDLSRVERSSGLILNYRLFGSAESGDGPGTQLTGDVELVAMTEPGIIVNEGFFASRGRRSVVRGNTFFRHEDPVRVRSYTVGDLVTGSVNWSRSVRLGGLQVQSAFQQRPDLFTGPLPQFTGSAALPSSVELYADSLRVFNANVPQGPFILRAIPTIVGNELRIVTTDRNGRQTEVTAPYFNAPGLLRKGIVEYSAELGVPRTDIGLRSFGYRDTLFASGTGRYGLSDLTTIEGHVEAGSDLINGGVGLVQALGRLGSITASASGSRFRGAEGARVEAQYRFDQPQFSLFANVQREFGNYLDLGDISGFRLLPNAPPGASLVPQRQRRAVERVGASFRPGFDPVSLNVTYNHFRFGEAESRTIDFGIRRRLNDRLSFRGNAIVDLERNQNLAVSVGLNLRLGRNTTGFVGADRSNGRSSYSASAVGFSGGRQNVLGYALSQRGNDDGDAFRSASLNYRFPETFVAGSIDQSGKDVRGTLQVEGSVVAAGGGVFLANRIGDAFAIVRNAGPGVDILQGGRRVARADRNGRALLASLEPFSETRVSIDPASLPAGLEAESGTDLSVVTERRRAALIDFGVRKVSSAIVVIFGSDGKAIAPGTEVRVEGGASGVMGYDGEVFLKDLKAANRITIDLGAGRACAAAFPYDPGEGAQPRIGPITCS